MWILAGDRHIKTLLLALTGLAGLALGIFAAALAGYLLQPDLGTTPSLPMSTSSQKRPKTLNDYQIILDRNLFNPDGPRLQFSATAAKRDTAAQTATAPATDWQLVGTVSGGSNPLATLRAQGKAQVWHQGDRLPDGSVLIRIERTRVRLRLADGRETILTLPENGSPAAKETAAPSRRQASASARTAKTSSAIGDGIRRLDDTSWQIPRLEADRARDNIGTLLRQARVEPNLVNGKTEGFVIRMIQPNTLLAKLGLRVGDVLHEINGIALDGPEKGLQIMQQLRQARRIDLALERQGKRMTYSYRID